MRKKWRLWLMCIGLLLIVLGVMVWQITQINEPTTTIAENEVLLEKTEAVSDANQVNHTMDINQKILKFEVQQSFLKKIRTDELSPLAKVLSKTLFTDDFFMPYDKINGPYSNQNQLFSEDQVPIDFDIAYFQQAYDTGIDWNFASYVCDYELAVSHSNTALFSFGMAYNKAADLTQRIEMAFPIIASSLAYTECIALMTRDNSGKVYLDLLDPFLNAIGHGQLNELEGMDSNHPVYLVPRDEKSFYVIYSKENRYFCSTFRFVGMPLDRWRWTDSSIDIQVEFLETYVIEENIQKVFVNNNIIGFTYLQEAHQGNTRLALMNRKLELLDVFELPDDFDCTDLLVWKFHDGLKYVFQGEYLDKAVAYKFEPKSNFEGKTYMNCIENTPYIDGVSGGLIKLLDKDYWGSNYYKWNGNIIKTSNHDSIIETIIRDKDLGSQLDRVYGVNEWIYGFSGDQLLFTDHSQDFLGLRAYGGEIKEGYLGGLIYIDSGAKAIMNINEDGKLGILAEIPAEITLKILESDAYYPPNIKEYEQGIALETQNVLYYYAKTLGLWNTDVFIHTDLYLPAFDPILEPFKMNYPFKRKYFDTLQWEQKVYMNLDNEFNQHEAIKNFPGIEPLNSEFVTLTNLGGQKELHIIDSREVGGRKIVQLHQSQGLIEVKTDEIHPLVDIKVREFDVNEKGILYTGYGDQSGTYFYNFETGMSNILYKEAACDELCLIGSIAFIITNKTELSRIDLGKSDSIQTYELSEFFHEKTPIHWDSNDELLNFGGQVLISGNAISLINPTTMTLTDQFEGHSTYVYQNRLFYSIGGLLAAYDIVSKTMEPITYDPFPEILYINDGIIVYGATRYEWGEYLSTALGQKYIEQTFEEAKDYYLFEYGEHFSDYSQLLIYDQKAKRITLLNFLSSLDYELLPTSIRYPCHSKEKWEQIEWKELPLPEGYTIGVYQKK